MAKYRRPPLYAAEWDSDYWKLLQQWKVLDLKDNAHPLLGWVKWNVWQKNLFHKDLQQLNGRRPVLLYGDSYAQHLDTSQTMRNLFEKDTAFNNTYKFINYGTGGYGTDQIHTLFTHTFCKTEKPIVIFSFLTLDLERSILNFRDGLKPSVYVNTDGNLAFDKSMISQGTDRYLRKHPPEIKSYLWRKFLFSDVNFLPDFITHYCTGETAARKKIIDLNTKILQDVIEKLQAAQTDYIFLIFDAPADYNTDDKTNWRMQFIQDFFKQNNVKHLYARDMIPYQLNIKDSATFYKYFVVNDGHPTNLYYSYIINKIKSVIAYKEYTSFNANNQNDIKEIRTCYPTYKQERDSVKSKLVQDPNAINEIKLMAQEKNITYDKSLNDLVEYLIWNQNEEYKQSLKHD